MDYEVISLPPATDPPPPPTLAEIWQDMLAGRISPALAEIRAAKAEAWPGYVKWNWRREEPSR